MDRSTRWVVWVTTAAMGCGTPSMVYVRDVASTETVLADVRVDAVGTDAGGGDIGSDVPGTSDVVADVLQLDTAAPASDVGVDASRDAASGSDVGVDAPSVVDVPVDVPVDTPTAPADAPASCSPLASTRCGRDLRSGWSLRPNPSATCDGAWVPQDFSSVAAATSLSTCGEASHLVANGSAAEITMAPLNSRCSTPTAFTLTMVGSLPTSYQRNLAFILRWPSGESIVVNRWVWNSASESAVDVQVSTTPGSLRNFVSSNADTGGARNDRPWGANLGNDAAGWWRMSLAVDPAGDRVTATFEQPSRSATVYTAIYSAPIPDATVPTLQLDSRASCGSSIDSRLLSLSASPSLWW